jgi:hypothetical protein
MAYVGDVAVYSVDFTPVENPCGNARPHQDGANSVAAVQAGDGLDCIDTTTWQPGAARSATGHHGIESGLGVELEFEWDEDKAATNLAKHQVSL